eukprot:TRINITY_DN1790_c0_g1_i1.p1 TRINITY_DN1790_c0_g1~~TRINITY_DN1790_c0_g1_i1.p1  ORF type:complete len:360 (+),score=130.31 TRINITY_DN1790_c0_g1_i1:40-1080(+)
MRLKKEREYSNLEEFNCVQVINSNQSINNINQSGILLGLSDGKIKMKGKEREESMETKGGSITNMMMQSVIPSSSSHSNLQLISGDADGNVVLFSEGEIVSRYSCGCAAVTSLAFDPNQQFILVGDSKGFITAFSSPSQFQWKIDTRENESKLEVRSVMTANRHSRDPSVNCLHYTTILDRFGVTMQVLLVSNGTFFLYFYVESTLVFVLPTPSKINSICSGRFTSTENGNEKNNQILLGCQDGFVYMVENFQLIRFFRVGNPISLLKPFKRNDSNLDSVLCVGHFNGIKLFENGNLLLDHKTEDWVHSLSLGSFFESKDQSDSNFIFAGQDNRSLSVFHLEESPP